MVRHSTGVRMFGKAQSATWQPVKIAIIACMTISSWLGAGWIIGAYLQDQDARAAAGGWATKMDAMGLTQYEEAR